MKTRRFLMGALALAMVAATVIACTKQNGLDTNNDTNHRNPIAVYDNNTRLITTLIDAEAINEKNDKSFFALKDDANRFVVESVEVLDSMPRNKNVNGEIKLTVLDTDDECSYSLWCMKSFVVKDVKEQQVDYYLDDNVASGNYNVAFKVQDKYYIADFIGDSLSIQEVDFLEYSCTPWVFFSCRSVDCTNQCDKTGTLFNATCKQCPYHDGQCIEESTVGTIVTIIILIVRVAKFFI